MKLKLIGILLLAILLLTDLTAYANKINMINDADMSITDVNFSLDLLLKISKNKLLTKNYLKDVLSLSNKILNQREKVNFKELFEIEYSEIQIRDKTLEHHYFYLLKFYPKFVFPSIINHQIAIPSKLYFNDIDFLKEYVWSRYVFEAEKQRSVFDFNWMFCRYPIFKQIIEQMTNLYNNKEFSYKEKILLLTFFQVRDDFIYLKLYCDLCCQGGDVENFERAIKEIKKYYKQYYNYCINSNFYINSARKRVIMMNKNKNK